MGSYGTVRWVFSRWLHSKTVRKRLWTQWSLSRRQEPSLSLAEETRPLRAKNTKPKTRSHIAAPVEVLLLSYSRGKCCQELRPLIEIELYKAVCDLRLQLLALFVGDAQCRRRPTTTCTHGSMTAHSESPSAHLV